ncbi:MAG TPA: capsule assembly Wzi family protein [Acidobacteriaceae bacterium]|nr:capsule assembly Wzi family protein [Acidobacteriaceae bacterium]
MVRSVLFLTLTAVPWLPLLGQQTANPATLPADLDQAFSSSEPIQSSNYGLVYVPLDSWVYPAFERLFSMGYADSAYLGMRPWTRTSCLQILEETYPKLQDAPNDQEAWRIFKALAVEFGAEAGQTNPQAKLHDAYTRNMYIKGRPINDSFHFGQTLINDYGRPYQGGFNALDGFTAWAQGYHFSLDVRGEYQHAPGRGAYPESVQQLISVVDSTPLLPAEPVPQTNVFRLINANFSTSLANHVISVGKTDDWWGPTQSGSMALSNNAEPLYALRINRVVPLRIPFVSDVLGPFRYEFLLGSLKGHSYPNAPWVHAQKFSFKPTRNLEFGFSRVVVFAGEGHVPLTFGSFWHSFTSFSNVSVAEKESRNDPGFRSSSFDFTWRLPFVENWLTLYTDSIVHDDVSPLAAPRRAAVNPGLYLSHLPKLPHFDLRGEAVSTDPVASSQGGQFLYYEYEYKDGYTNKGNLFGSWMGREGKGGQVWLTDWLSPKEYIQLGYRNAKVSKTFIPGGTTQNDINIRAVLRLKDDLELNAFGQAEFWKVPAMASGPKNDFTGSFQLTYFPRLSWRK